MELAYMSECVCSFMHICVLCPMLYVEGKTRKINVPVEIHFKAGMNEHSGVFVSFMASLSFRWLSGDEQLRTFFSG